MDEDACVSEHSSVVSLGQRMERSLLKAVPSLGPYSVDGRPLGLGPGRRGLQGKMVQYVHPNLVNSPQHGLFPPHSQRVREKEREEER